MDGGESAPASEATEFFSSINHDGTTAEASDSIANCKIDEVDDSTAKLEEVAKLVASVEAQANKLNSALQNDNAASLRAQEGADGTIATPARAEDTTLTSEAGQEQEYSTFEEFAKAAVPLAKWSERFEGIVKSYSPNHQWGLLDCDRTKAVYGRDVFMQRREYEGSGAQVGSKVTFQIKHDDTGRPQAMRLKGLDDNGNEIRREFPLKGVNGCVPVPDFGGTIPQPQEVLDARAKGPHAPPSNAVIPPSQPIPPPQPPPPPQPSPPGVELNMGMQLNMGTTAPAFQGAFATAAAPVATPPATAASADPLDQIRALAQPGFMFPGVMTGVIKAYSAHHGCGFISCPQIHALFKSDVLLTQREFEASGTGIGTAVRFQVQLDNESRPQARNLEIDSSVQVPVEPPPPPPPRVSLIAQRRAQMQTQPPPPPHLSVPQMPMLPDPNQAQQMPMFPDPNQAQQMPMLPDPTQTLAMQPMLFDPSQALATMPSVAMFPDPGAPQMSPGPIPGAASLAGLSPEAAALIGSFSSPMMPAGLPIPAGPQPRDNRSRSPHGERLPLTKLGLEADERGVPHAIIVGPSSGAARNVNTKDIIAEHQGGAPSREDSGAGKTSKNNGALFAEGQLVRYWSMERNKWLSCQITAVDALGRVQINLINGKWFDRREQGMLIKKGHTRR